MTDKCWASGKIKHKTKREAINAGEQLSQSPGRSLGHRFHAYKCMDCKSWHIGHWRKPIWQD